MHTAMAHNTEDCHTDPKPIAVAVVEHAAKFLIGRRPDGVELGGLWEFPGGKIEPDETPAQAAVRECHEEAGLWVEAGSSLGEVTHDYGDFAVHIHFIACRLLDGAAQIPATYRWVRPDDFADYKFPAATAAMLKKLRPKPGGRNIR